MSKLGLGLLGAAASLKEYERLQDKERRQRMEDEQWGWKRQQAESELALLPDQEDAARSGYQLKQRQNAEALGLVDLQSGIARKKLEMEGAGLDAAKERMPYEHKLESNKVKVNAALSDFDVSDLPRKLMAARQQGVISKAEMEITGAAMLGKLIQGGEEQQVLQFYNDIKNVTGSSKGQAARVVVSEQNNSGERALIFQDENGRTLDVLSKRKIQQAMQASNKIDYKVLKPGQTLVGVSGGRAVSSYTVPGAEAAPTTLQRNTEYLVGQLGMTKEQALSYLKSGGSKEGFMTQFAQNKMSNGFGMPTRAEMEAASQLYDQIHAAKQTPQANSQDALRSQIEARLYADTP